jgi:isoquinoline 1-oxidoreductase subunit beta
LSAAAAGGGLAIGLRFASFHSKNKTIEPESGEIHNWIVVAPDNSVTIRIAQMEMGQGAMTAMAQLLSEELEVDWSKVKTDFISIAEQMRRNGVFGSTETGASMGVRRSELPLRTAGAQIRTMLVRAASQRLGVPESELVAKKSVITHTLTGTTLTYGELAAAAAEVAIPDSASVKLKDPRDWKCIGKPLKRLDLPMKVDGTAIFGIDVQLPGMKHAAIMISPIFGGRLKHYDAKAALALPAVHKIVEIKGVGRLDDAIAVVADDWWQAKRALDTIQLEWDGGAWATVDSDAILASLRTGLKGPSNKILRNDGDVEAAMASAARILEADYFSPYLENATMEPMNCTALVTDESFEVWAPTQVPEKALKAAAEIAGMPISKGNLHPTQMGGGFGRRQQSDFVEQAVYIAKTMKGIPVKLLWSREETMRHGFYRPANVSRVRAAIDGAGNITAWSHRIAASSDSEALNVLGSDQLLYAIPNMRIDLAIRPSHVPEGRMRGVAFATHSFVTQTFIDEVARAVGKDVYEFQRALLDPDRTPGTAPVALEDKNNLSPRERAVRLRSVLDEVAEKAGWGRPLGANQGRGIATHEEAEGFYAVVVEVTLDGKGWLSIDRVVVAGDPGYLVNPACADAQVEGSVAFALTAAMYGAITIRDGRVMEANFDDYKMLRIHEMPKVETHWVLSSQPPWGGVGEPVVAPVIPALVNALYDAGGPRIRSLPLMSHEIVKRGEGARVDGN